MTDQEINIAIAESVGWQEKEIAIKCRCPDCQGYECCRWDFTEMPNYVADLNAMNEVWVQKIKNNPELEDEFVKQLAYAVGYEGIWLGLSDADVAIITNASAHQRAEAYLKTIGKWKE